MEFIPVCESYLGGNELKYVTDAVQSGWISASGKYVEKFELQFADYCGAGYGTGVCNGTAAIHLALVALGIGPGDEVIVPSFTMVSSAFAVCYTGAMPVFVDVDPDFWTIDPVRIEEKITRRTKAIMTVSIFGHPCDMTRIWALAGKYGLKVVEDAAEAHGAEFEGKKTGALADITAFSFFANKNLTTGEGGMVLTSDPELHRRAVYFRNICFPTSGPRNFCHADIGFNYRLSNLHAAIGVAQVEKADEYRGMRIRNAALYRKHLAGTDGVSFQKTMDNVINVHWMNGILLDPLRYGKTRTELMAHLEENGIDTRLFFLGMHRQPSLVKYGCDCTGIYPVSDNLSENGFYLPSSSNLDEGRIAHICRVISLFGR
jgi:perosamine synthetase